MAFKAFTDYGYNDFDDFLTDSPVPAMILDSDIMTLVAFGTTTPLIALLLFPDFVPPSSGGSGAYAYPIGG
jgi:hypothetical protein